MRHLGNVTFIMDNASFPKCAEIKHIFFEKGHTLIFLPPYRPFFNHIENIFAQWKNEIRARNPQNEQELVECINTIHTIVTPGQRTNYSSSH